MDSDTATIPAVLARAARRYPDGEAVVEGPRRLSYSDLHARVRAFAGALVAAGVRPGDRVAVCSPNTHHWVIAALGALCAGTTLVPINTRFTGTETLDILARSRARAFVVAGHFLGADRLAGLRAAAAAEGDGSFDGPVSGLADLRTVVRVPVDRDDSDGPHGNGVLDWAELPDLAASAPAGEVEARAAAVRAEDVSDILFTSGTTGRSKGVRSAHHQALSVAAAWADCAVLDHTDRYLVINPFFHSFGYKAGILACLLTGATLVPQATFDVERAMALVAQEHITVLPGPPTIYQTMLDHSARGRYDMSSLRLAVTGAATVPVALVERMQTELSFRTVLTAYGLTEAVVATMCRPDDDAAIVAATCGRAAAGFDVRVVDDAGRLQPPGEPGEVQLRGPNAMLDYLDDPAATRRAIDVDGWLHTGDVGRLDARGYLTITDRLKDMYICGGFNVYPAEVEQALARLDGLAESAVIGVPDPRLGEVGAAYIVRGPGHELSADQVLAYCQERLANYKRPRYVEFRDELPRNAAGKVRKIALRRDGR